VSGGSFVGDRTISRKIAKGPGKAGRTVWMIWKVQENSPFLVITWDVATSSETIDRQQ
jgi:predicted SnoaL-like aldol condensation-catalyzing enzyme